MHLITPLLSDQNNQFNSVVIKKIEQFFSITYFGSDISIISKLEVRLAFFILNDSRNYQLLSMALSICENLNKKIIIISSCSIPERISNNKSLIGIVNIQDIHLSHQLEILKNKTEHIFNIHYDLGREEQKVTKDTSFVTLVSDFVLKNITSDIKETEIAEICHCSASYFSKKFRQHFGICFRDFVCDKRVMLAKELMQRDSHAKIAVIAYQCGYNDVSYFSRIFKKRTGVTPASYRRVCLNKR